MEGVVLANSDKTVPELKELLHKECVAIKEEDVWMCRQIGEYGLSLIQDGCGILTHCNAGQLATSKYGTALAPIHLGRERGMCVYPRAWWCAAAQNRRGLDGRITRPLGKGLRSPSQPSPGDGNAGEWRALGKEIEVSFPRGKYVRSLERGRVKGA